MNTENIGTQIGVGVAAGVITQVILKEGTSMLIPSRPQLMTVFLTIAVIAAINKVGALKPVKDLIT